MLAGPSSSGKTTTSYILAENLERLGYDTLIISLDDFFRGHRKAPMLKDGAYDYEHVEALDIEQLKGCLLNLIENGYCEKPVFDFINRQPSGHKVKLELKFNTIAIVEGLHALNPSITRYLPKDDIFKVYVSVKQGVKDSDEMILSPVSIRLLRRIVRDNRFRASLPEETIVMWSNVCKGESFHVQPFKVNSDITINSIHMYEPCILCHDALPLLKMIPCESRRFNLALRLIKTLEMFVPIDSSLVPRDSLLREFIGGGIY